MQEETVKLFDSEIKVMDILWKEGDLPAKVIADTLTGELGWNKNTTYTLIKRCIKKGAIERSEPNFICHALIPKEKIQEAETNELINKIYASAWCTSRLGAKSGRSVLPRALRP